MKKLFVIHTINNITKKENKEKLCCNEKKDLENNITPLKLSEEHLILSNSEENTTLNGSGNSRKSLTFLKVESPSLNINTLFNKNEENVKKNEFLGKKMKLRFDIIKDSSDNNTSSSSLILDNTLNKKTEENDSIEKNNVKKNKNLKKKKFCFNEGRWSFEEHKKFIEALVEYRKNWKKIQMYVGTRSSSQVRSHSQKFLLKIKASENLNLNFDFKINKIKNLNDLIEEFIKKEQNNDNDKKLIIDSLINLSLAISEDNLRNSLKGKKAKKNKNWKHNSNLNENKIFHIKYEYHDKENDYINTINIINENNDVKKEISEKRTLSKNEDETNVKNEQYNININNFDSAKNEINNINEENSTKESKDNSIIKENNTNYIEETILVDDNNKDHYYNNNKKLFFDDGLAFFMENLEFINYNNTSLRIKEYNYHLNYEEPAMTNKYFFS